MKLIGLTCVRRPGKSGLAESSISKARKNQVTGAHIAAHVSQALRQAQDPCTRTGRQCSEPPVSFQAVALCNGGRPYRDALAQDSAVADGLVKALLSHDRQLSRTLRKKRKKAERKIMAQIMGAAKTLFPDADLRWMDARERAALGCSWVSTLEYERLPSRRGGRWDESDVLAMRASCLRTAVELVHNRDAQRPTRV